MATLKHINKEIKHIKKRLSHLKLDVYALEGSEQANDDKKTKLYEKIKLFNKELEKKLLEKTEILGHQASKLDDDVILKLDGLTMRFGGLVAVDNLSFEVKKGEVFGLIGPNGAGKTTVFNCITQFYKASSGNIIYRNKDNDVVNLSSFKVHNVIKEGIVRTFQNVELIWELSILENLLIAGHTLYHANFFDHLLKTRRFKKEEKAIRARAVKVLNDVGLTPYMYAYPMGLPYGILKLVELARTLMTEPKLIILDEPAAGLNEQETAKLTQTIKNIQKNYDCTIFLVEHDMGLVMKLCDTICAISFGKKLAIGTPAEIKQNKTVQEAYLGGE
jgi:branched-chain amino acid transport system ATP-binding protein